MAEPMAVTADQPAVSSAPPGDSYARLSGPALFTARLLWLAITLLACAVFVGKIAQVYGLLSHPPSGLRPLLEQIGISPTFYAALMVGVEILTALVFFAVAIALALLRSDLLPALLAATAFMAFGASGVTLTVLPQLDARWLLPVALLGFTYRITFVVFLYVFPDGRFVPPWTKALVPLWVVITLLAALPSNVPISASHWPPLVEALVEIVLDATVVYAQVYRYRRVSSPAQRRQTRWVAWGVLLAIPQAFLVQSQRVAPGLSQFASADMLLYELIFVLVLDLSMMLIPLSVGIAVLRYHLYDIDIIINRTLVYVPLTAIIAGLFSGAKSLVQKLFLTLTGQHSDVAAVVATVIVAAAFEPIRRLLQTAVDKRFTDVAEPEKLNAFQEGVRQPLQTIAPASGIRYLLEEAVAAFGAEGGAAYVERDGELALLGTSGAWRGDAEVSAVVETPEARWGQVVLGARRSGRAYTSQDRAALLQAAQMLALALAQDQGAEQDLPTRKRLTDATVS